MTSTNTARPTGALRPTRIAAMTAALMLCTSAALAGHAQRLDGTLRVINDRLSPVVLALDGHPLGRVPSGATRSFPNIPNGVRVLRVAARGQVALVQRVVVPIERVVTHRVKAVLGEAVIYNDSRVVLRVRVDGRAVGRVAPGEVLEVERLRAGRHTLTSARLNRSGPRLSRAFTVRAGQHTKLTTGRWYASLRVTNTAGRRARLEVDGRRAGRLDPGETRELRDLAPGVHEIVLRRHHERLAQTRVELSPGERDSWSPTIQRTGALRISNDARRPARVDLDGRHLARLDAGERRTFSDIPAGRHTVTAHYPHGGTRTWTVRVQRRALTRLALHARRGGSEQYLAVNAPLQRD